MRPEGIGAGFGGSITARFMASNHALDALSTTSRVNKSSHHEVRTRGTRSPERLRSLRSRASARSSRNRFSSGISRRTYSPDGRNSTSSLRVNAVSSTGMGISWSPTFIVTLRSSQSLVPPSPRPTSSWTDGVGAAWNRRISPTSSTVTPSSASRGATSSTKRTTSIPCSSQSCRGKRALEMPLLRARSRAAHDAAGDSSRAVGTTLNTAPTCASCIASSAKFRRLSRGSGIN